MIAIEELKKITDNNYLIYSVILIVIGVFIDNIIHKIRNKSGKFGYISYFNRIALSMDDPIFGSIKITWRENPVKNLYLFIIEVENLTYKDYEDLEFKVYSGDDTIILNEKTAVINSPYIIPLSKSYLERLTVPEGQQLNPQQMNEYNHNREYLLPTFNRGQKIRFSYLCSKPNDVREPGVFISTLTKGIKLKKLKNPSVIINPILNVPVPIAVFYALIIAALVIVLCGLFIRNIWWASAISMSVGLTGQLFGAIAYRVEKFIKNIFAG